MNMEPLPLCSVHGTTLYDETAYDLIKRQRAFANASPLLPFRESSVVLFRKGGGGGGGGDRPASVAQNGTGAAGKRVVGGSSVVEIVGGNGSGKTTCCLHAACICVMPCTLGGYESGALMIDCDGKFDLFRFVQMLECKIVERMDGGSGEERDTDANNINNYNYNNDNGESENDRLEKVQQVFRESLSRMFVVKCWNTLQLLATTFFISASFEEMIVSLQHSIC